MNILALFVVLILNFLSPGAQSLSEYPYMGSATCDDVAAAYHATINPWLGYPEGWTQPADLEWFRRIRLEGDAEIWIHRAVSDPSHEYLTYLFDKEITTALDGTHPGYHHICALVRPVSAAQLALDRTRAALREVYRRAWIATFIN